MRLRGWNALMRPLEGILVVALEQAVAAPLCTARLADAGARVVKIERAEGDFAREYDHVVHGESAYFVWLNRGKESLTLDIKQEADRDLFLRLLARADIFIQNLAPGAAERAGFGSDALRARFSHLITCDISGYGESGPCRDMKAYDFLIQCESGLTSITGGANEPGRVGVSVADIACGMNAHAAILEALFARGRDGRGRGVAVSLFDGMAEWMSVPLLHYDYAGKAPARAGLHHATIAPYGAYKTAGGREVVFAIQNEREWKSFCAIVLEQAALAQDLRFNSNSQRTANRAALDAVLSPIFSGLDADALIARLKTASIAYASLNSIADLSAHPQLRRIDVETPTGPAAIPAPPAIRRGERLALGAVPRIGGHSAAIRAEFA
jgi:itaconate CoA-transferase